MADTPEQRFAALVTPHFATLYRVALRLTRKRQDAEDLVQEVCVRAFACLHDLESAAQPRGWLLQVQYRLFVDGARRRRRSPFAPGHDDSRGEPVSDEPAPDDSAEAALGHTRLAAAWEHLDDDQRALLALHAEGYTLSELESVLRVSRNALSARLHRARGRLAKLLRNQTERCAPALEKSR